MSGLQVIQPGVLSLLQDAGRFGQHSIGLTTGGPLDRTSFRWANRLCKNADNRAALEITLGGLVLQSHINGCMAVTGAEIPLSINGQKVPTWQTHLIRPGDRIELGYATSGSRAYLAVAGGIRANPCFDSQSTVPREGLGGLHGDGRPLKTGDVLPCHSLNQAPDLLRLAKRFQPQMEPHSTHLRMVLGYQQDAFSTLHKQLFFTSEYTVSEKSDRMGYRLKGPAIKPSLSGILSEGICLGAIQFPADGQPIVLLSDRQTIGGYPKLGSVLSLDIDKLAQLMPGGTLRFEAIDIDRAHNLLQLSERQFHNTQLEKICADNL